MRSLFLISMIVVLLPSAALAQTPKSTPPAKASATAATSARPTVIPLDAEKMKSIGAFEPLAKDYTLRQGELNRAKEKAQTTFNHLLTVDLEKLESGALAIYAFREARRALADAEKLLHESAARINEWMAKVRQAHGVGQDYGLSDDAKSLVKQETPPDK